MQNKINVCMVTSSYFPNYSGYSKQAHQVNKRLSNNNDIEVTVITKRFETEYKYVDGIKVIHLPRLSFKVNQKQFINLTWIVSTIMYLIKNRKNIDVIHVLGTGTPALILSMISKVIGKPILVKKFIEDSKEKKLLKHKIRDFFLKRLAYIVTISDEIKRALVKNGFDENRMVFIPNGVNTVKFQPVTHNDKMLIRDKLGIKRSNFIAAYVGLKNKRKGTDILIKSWNKFLNENKNALLLLIGPSKDTTFYQWLIEYIESNNLQNNVQVLGNVENVEDYLKSSDIFLFPSEREGLPNALIEAMSCGLACICREIGGVTDLIEHNNNGILIDNQGEQLIEDLSQTIKALYDDRRKISKMGREARKTICRNYSLDNVANKYKQLYRYIC